MVVAARVRYESVIKAIVFIPMSIAATALAVIWKFVYSPDANIGLLNASLGAVGVQLIGDHVTELLAVDRQDLVPGGDAGPLRRRSGRDSKNTSGRHSPRLRVRRRSGGSDT